MITSSAKSLAGESTTSHVCLRVVSIRSCIHYLSSPLYGKCRICQVSEERCGPIANQIPVSKSQPPISFAWILNNMIKVTFNGARRPCMDWTSYFSETAHSGLHEIIWDLQEIFHFFKSLMNTAHSKIISSTLYEVLILHKIFREEIWSRGTYSPDQDIDIILWPIQVRDRVDGGPDGNLITCLNESWTQDVVTACWLICICLRPHKYRVTHSLEILSNHTSHLSQVCLTLTN